MGILTSVINLGKKCYQGQKVQIHLRLKHKMSINIIKLAVGIQDIDHLKRVQEIKLRTSGLIVDGVHQLYHTTRNMPKKSNEILKGGSIYWVIRGVLQIRQPIIGIKKIKTKLERPVCAIILKQKLIRTHPKTVRAFQGWRYLTLKEAPNDLIEEPIYNSSLPKEMAKELKVLGLM